MCKKVAEYESFSKQVQTTGKNDEKFWKALQILNMHLWSEIGVCNVVSLHVCIPLNTVRVRDGTLLEVCLISETQKSKEGRAVTLLNTCKSIASTEMCVAFCAFVCVCDLKTHKADVLNTGFLPSIYKNIPFTLDNFKSVLSLISLTPFSGCRQYTYYTNSYGATHSVSHTQRLLTVANFQTYDMSCIIHESK